MSKSGMMDLLLGELEREHVATRKVLQRVPDEHLAWTPHERSMSLGKLSMHVAGLPSGIAALLTPDEVPIPSVPTPEASSRDEILETLEHSVSEARDVLQGWGESHLHGTWRMMINGRPVMEAQRYEVLRSLLFNHWYHHRGQLTVYLRMLDVPLPNIYGPTADER
jgi:uncharacterized damage-inducible protein DinB